MLSYAIHIGSTNCNKVEAVQEVIATYPTLQGCHVHGISVDSGVREQPLSLEEVVVGAKNRAQNSFSQCRYGIGLESGLVPLPTTDDYMAICVCSVFDGEEHHIGTSAGITLPKQVTEKILTEGLDLGGAMNACDLTANPHLGASEGFSGILTNGRICRKDLCREALICALSSIENAHYYVDLCMSE